LIVEQLCSYIADNAMTPGDRLPAERDLAVKLGVSRASLSQALVALEVQGVLSVRHGDGAILVRRPTEKRAITALREHADRIPDIIEAREALEVKLAGLAAARRGDAEMAGIDAAIEKMESEIEAGDRGVVGDEMFHLAITTAAHSSLIAKLMHEISGLIRETRIESLSQEDRPRASLEAHRRIADACADRIPMRHHARWPITFGWSPILRCCAKPTDAAAGQSYSVSSSWPSLSVNRRFSE
jgi:GntR family transcriptional repressor for pyruvate dehydrogenase complex